MIQPRFFGRMGNVLFQGATAIGLALKYGVEFSVPNRTNDNYFNPLYLQHLVNPKWEQGREDVLINENGVHEYHEIEWKNEWKDKQVALDGYWQSEKYFQEYRDEILYLFNFPYEKKDGYVSVHVRRGDYLHLRDKHPEVTKGWYENAMSLFPGYRFKFFSDDITWCINEFSGRDDCEFSVGNTPEINIGLMSCCEHNISSSSTFGWWGAWLNRNQDKKVYIPKLWFVEGYSVNDKDIVPDWMTKI